MAKVTSSNSRSKRSTKKPVSTDKGRKARARVSTAKVSRSGQGGGSGSAKVTPSRGGERGSGSSPSTQSADAKRFQQLNQSKSARDGKAQEIRQRRTAARAAKPAPGTGNVVKTAIKRGQNAKDTKLKETAQRNRTSTLGILERQNARQRARLKGATAALSGPKGLAVNAIVETVAPRPTAKGTLSAGGAQGPNMPKRLKEQGYAAQEKRAKAQNAARKGDSFDDAFKDARRAKVKTFTWRGKKYTTEMK